MSEHTKEPWAVATDSPNEYWKGDGTEVYSDKYGRIAETSINRLSPLDQCQANARRIVACVNACAGIENKELEAVTYAQLLESHRFYEQQCRSLQSANAELVEALVWLSSAAGDSNDSQYGTLSASWVKEIADAALAKHKASGVKP